MGHVDAGGGRMGSSWKAIANSLAVQLIDHVTCRHSPRLADCPSCTDRAALTLWKDAAKQDRDQPFRPAAWRKIAVALGARMRNMKDCPTHDRRVRGCPFCDDARAYRRFEQLARRRGISVETAFDRVSSQAPSIPLEQLTAPKERA